jgi:hypothetical protein
MPADSRSLTKRCVVDLGIPDRLAISEMLNSGLLTLNISNSEIPRLNDDCRSSTEFRDMITSLWSRRDL